MNMFELIILILVIVLGIICVTTIALCASMVQRSPEQKLLEDERQAERMRDYQKKKQEKK